MCIVLLWRFGVAFRWANVKRWKKVKAVRICRLHTCTGAAQSPDALYIYASIDAANEILNICLRLATMGVLGYLPSRYLINFVFGGVFALKAGYSGAVGRSEIVK